MTIRGLMGYPTHKNCEEQCASFARAGVWAECYPARNTNPSHPEQPLNCWNEKADIAERMGFPVVRTVCPRCPRIGECQSFGYLAGLKQAAVADFAFVTHKRLEHAKFEGLLEGRTYVSIHEAAIDILRPKKEICESDLRNVQSLINCILSDPYYLDWFGDIVRFDDDGLLLPDEELSLRRDRLYEYICEISRMVDELVDHLGAANTHLEWRCPMAMRRPIGLERTLFRAVERENVKFQGQPWSFILAAAGGELISAGILVINVHRKATDREQGPIKLIVGYVGNHPPPNIVTWFNDATISPDRLAALLGHPIHDTTPPGKLAILKKAVQIPRDVTRGTSGKTVQNILRGVLADRPERQNIGVICHQVHIGAIKKLEPEYLRRIEKISYFGSGDERSSNDWHERCDLIVIVGTPRVPPATIAAYLIQVGEIGEACREPKWGPIQWEGRTEADESVLVKSSGYLDPAWRRAYQEHVRSTLVQSIGRGRGILETGCEVLLLSNEEAGLRISDAEATTLNASSAVVLAKLTEITTQNANKYFLGKCVVKSSELVAETKLSPTLVRTILRSLEERGLVIREGERQGWRLTTQPGAESESPDGLAVGRDAKKRSRPIRDGPPD